MVTFSAEISTHQNKTHRIDVVAHFVEYFAILIIKMQKPLG